MNARRPRDRSFRIGAASLGACTMTRRSEHLPDTANPISRRRLLTAGAVIPIVSASRAGDIRGEMPWQEGRTEVPTAEVDQKPGERYVFFNAAEAAFVEAAVGRLIPEDDLGPGALKAGVPTFIDRQLAGDYGNGARWYMQGPWAKGEATQGWQTRLTPAGLYRAAVREIDEAANREAHKAFSALAPAEQETWLHRLEDGKLALPTVDAKAFFKLLWQNTLEGFWSDPIHGGNRDMVGWKLIGFPGARYDLSAHVGEHGKPYPLPPLGLRGRPDWHRS